MGQKISLSICADDFGITHNVNKGIIKLISKKRLTEISCIVLTENFKRDAKKIKTFKNKVGIGLHLTLTDFKPLSKKYSLKVNGNMPSNKSLLYKCMLKRIDKKQIFNEIDLQIQNFKKYLGFDPNFIDGHHHVHQFPLIKECLIDVIKKRKLVKKIWVRNTDDEVSKIINRNVSILKTLIISFFGKKFKHLVKKNSIKTNNGFSGIYNFSSKVNFDEIFSKFIKHSGNKHVLMVHPGYSDKILSSLDSVTITRDMELNFLLSNNFINVIKKKNKILKKF